MPLVTANQFQLAPDISSAARSGLNAFQQVQSGQRQQQQLGIQQSQEDRRVLADRFKSVADAAVQVKNLPDDHSKFKFLQRRKVELDAGGIDSSDTDEALDLFASGQPEKANALIDSVIKTAEQTGVLKPAGGQLSSEGRAFSNLIKDFSEEDKISAKRRKAGLESRAVGSAAQTISELGTAQAVAESEGIITEGKESGKQRSQLKFKPMIAEAVKLADEKAKAKGGTITELSKAKAALPGLKESISQLKELAPIATSTLIGRVFDTAVKETGFSSTKGANARAKFIAIINNQVLPLLKQTFGAAFTEKEGETLKATMGDPNSSPAEKAAQLDVFIAQKEQQIQAKKIELGQAGGQGELSEAEQAELQQLRAELGQ